MAGIDSIVNTRADAFTNNPQALMQRYAMGQDLLDLLALQKLKQDKEAAARSLQMNMQAPQGTIKDQLNSQVMDMTKQEVASSLAPGIQQQGQRMAAQQAQNMMGAGLPTQPAPALVGMAGGGIVGYAPGGLMENRLERSAVESAAQRKERERILREFNESLDGSVLPPGSVPPVTRYPATPSREGTTFDRRQAAAAANEAARNYQILRGEDEAPNIVGYDGAGNPITQEQFDAIMQKEQFEPGFRSNSGGTSVRRDVPSNVPVSDELAGMAALGPQALRRIPAEFEPGFRSNSGGTSVRRDVPSNVPVSDELAGMAALGPQALRRIPAEAGQRPRLGGYLASTKGPEMSLAEAVSTIKQFNRNPAVYMGVGAGVSQGEEIDRLKYSNAIRVLAENDITEQDLVSARGQSNIALFDNDESARNNLAVLQRQLDRINAYDAYGLPAPERLPPKEELERKIRAAKLFLNPDVTPATTQAEPATTQTTPATPQNTSIRPAGIATLPEGADITTRPNVETRMGMVNTGVSSAGMPPELAQFISDRAPRTTAERPQFRSRYEDRLAEIEAEKQDRLGALIEFLQAAGASGGTNLGATLMGGGSGLRARDERLRQQETEALQGAIADENAYLQRMFNEEQLRQQSESARLDRESRENIASEDRAARLDEANATAAANIQKAIFEANQNANEADIEVNTYAHEAVLADQEFILAKQAILDKYASSMFSSGNPQQAAAEISALYRKMFNQVKNYITNPGSGAAGRFSASYQ